MFSLIAIYIGEITLGLLAIWSALLQFISIDTISEIWKESRKHAK